MEHKTDSVEEKLDRITAILTLAFHSELEQARERMREDEVVSSLIDRLSSWTSSGAIRSSVAKTTGQSERTVGRRLSELVRLGVIAQRGSGPAIEYRSTGLI